MQKEKKPQFFSFNIASVIIGIVSFFALFGFWNKLDDLDKIVYIIVPTIILIFIVYLVIYCKEVKRFYNSYSKLYDNNQALIDNYKNNKIELTQEKYNNDVLRDFVNNTMVVLMTYNDMTKDERLSLRKEIVSKFINRDSNGGSDNE